MFKRLIFYWLPFVFWCLMIFFFSSKPTISTSEAFWWDFLIKKSAHLFEYFVLYVLVYRLSINEQFNYRWVKFYYPLIFVVIYAISDEFHQSFIPGREARARDVLIDSFGAVIAIWTIKNLSPKIPRKLINWVNI